MGFQFLLDFGHRNYLLNYIARVEIVISCIELPPKPLLNFQGSQVSKNEL